MSLKEVFVIWILKFPTTIPSPQSFAATEGEARKEVLRLAREEVNIINKIKGVDEVCTVEPIWKGAEVIKAGPAMIYTNAGPVFSSIDVRIVKETVGWFGGSTFHVSNSIEPIRVYYTSLCRVGSEITKKADFSFRDVPIAREDTPRNQIEELRKDSDDEEEDMATEEEIETEEGIETEEKPEAKEVKEEPVQPLASRKRRNRRRASPLTQSANE
jgi:hypothetical protein